MSRVNAVLIVTSLLAVALALPLVLVEYRMEYLHCYQKTPIVTSCNAGEADTLVLPTRSYIKPGLVEVWGLYAREGFSATTAKVAGIAIPFALFLLTILFVVFQVRRWRRTK